MRNELGRCHLQRDEMFCTVLFVVQFKSLKDKGTLLVSKTMIGLFPVPVKK